MVPMKNREGISTEIWKMYFFKLKILDLKITIIEMKNSLHGLKSRMEMAEEEAVKRH